jgi:hypothetical protein
LSLVHVKLDANNIQWKLNWIELERENENIFIYNFPINRWLDSNRNQKLDILIKEGPVQLGNFTRQLILLYISSFSKLRSIQLLYVRVLLVDVLKQIFV